MTKKIVLDKPFLNVNSILIKRATVSGIDVEYMPKLGLLLIRVSKGLWCYIIKYASNVPSLTKTILYYTKLLYS